MKIENYAFEGEGMQRVFENEKWTVGSRTGNRQMILLGLIVWNDTTKQMSYSFLWKVLVH